MTASISVVIPLYNKAAYVSEAVRSACEQISPPCEVIVVNDGSTDGSADIVRELPYANLKLIDIPNSGVSVARNTGIDAATGDYIAFLDADDWWSPHFLCVIQRLISRHAGCSIYSTGAIELCTGESLPEVDGAALAGNEGEIIHNYFQERSKRPLFHSSSFCVPRSLLLEERIRYPIGESHGEDHDFWFQLVERGAVAYLDVPLVAYRRGVANSLTQIFDWKELEPAYQRLWRRTFAKNYPAHLRRSARHLVHRRQTGFARNRLVIMNDAPGALYRLFFRNYRPGASVFWWGTLLGCLLPAPVRRRFLAPGKGWKDHPAVRRILIQARLNFDRVKRHEG